MISIENISKSYGGQVLFAKTGFRVNSRERVGLVGRNGHGKTTLFRLIAGREDPDEGRIAVPRNYRIGYVRQHIDFSAATVLDEACLGLPPDERDAAWKAEKILAGLGFSDEDMGRSPDTFSGGFQVRLNLARELLAAPDLLLLDEPTNYLDIVSIRWITNFLRSWPGELLLITHDRGFMDGVVTHTVGIHRGVMRKIRGDTGKYYEQLARDEEIHEKTRLNDERKRKEVELFITRFRAKARLAGMVQSRIKSLEKMGKREKLVSPQNLDFSFRARPFPARRMMRVKGLRFSWPGEPPLINGLDFILGAGDRVCIIGPNGKGKTTLLRLLAGTLTPSEGGVERHNALLPGLFEQTNIQTLDPARTVVDEILYADSDVDRQQARNIAGAMMFTGDAALKKVRVLSGGEKSRVMLGRLLATPVNLLLLDEPSNHLDMESCDALMAAIDHFEGAVIMVTHNEMFLRALARRLIVFRQGAVEVFEGGYEDFLEKGGWEDGHGGNGPTRTASPSKSGGCCAAAVLDAVSSAPAPENTAPRRDRKVLRRLRSDIISRKSAAVKPLEKQISAAEAEIDRRETEQSRLNEELLTASQNGDSERIAALSRSLREAGAIIESEFDRLEALTGEKDALSAGFDAELAALERETESP